MALIICPECGREISDMATNCPHCGYPLSVERGPVSDQTYTPGVSDFDMDDFKVPGKDFIPEDTPENAVVTRKRTPVVPIIITVACFIVIAAACVIIGGNLKDQSDSKARQEYIDNLNDFLYTALDGGAQAESVCNLTKQVWSDTIYEDYDSETAPYTQTNGVFHDDFNTSLTKLYSSDEMISSIESIKQDQAEVEALYKALLDPTEEFEKCFDEVEELYSIYYRFTKLAISPSGSLKTYSEDFSDLDTEFMEHYDKLKMLIPEE